jgi:DNA-binding transcriptional LysR family regulator
LSELAAFVKVVQAGSFTRAADSLGMQKANLSRLIANRRSAWNAISRDGS